MSDTPEVTTPTRQHNPYLIPGAIVLAGVAIALAIIVTQTDASRPAAQLAGGTLAPEVLPITEEDHVRGPDDPLVYFIEYSDYRCGFCGRFHDTIRTIMDENEGKIAWVYRHTPYQPGGREAAIASECIAEIVGKDAFWTFTDTAMKNQAAITPAWLRSTAVELGASADAYDACIVSGRHDEVLAKHTNNAQDLGSRGTPYTVLLTKDGQSLTFAGALPIDRVRVLVDRALTAVE